MIDFDLQQLRRAFGDYQALAANSDPLYQQWSPILHESQANSGLIEFSLDIDLPDPGPGRLEEVKQRVNSWLSTTSNGLKWVLRTRRKTEIVLSDFQKWNSKLKDIAAACMIDDVTRISALATTMSTARRLEEVVQEPDAQSLGLGLPAALKRLTIEPAATSEDFELHGYELQDPDEQDAGLSSGCIRRSGGGFSEHVLIEYKEFGQAVTQGSSTTVQQLASLLSASRESELAALPFRGYIKTTGLSHRIDTYAFIFDFPKANHQDNSISLHSALHTTSSKANISLSKRFQLAETLTKAVWYLNTVGWIHKSIRSANIVFFLNERSQADFATPHLIGFEYARLESDMTEYTGYDEDLEKNLYRHPERQGPPTVRFQKSHDLYALGLVLLEIGLWKTLSEMLEGYQNENKIDGDRPLVNPRRIMEHFRKLVDEELAHGMGESYAAAVRYCLDAVDGAEGDSVRVYNEVVLKIGLDNLLAG